MNTKELVKKWKGNHRYSIKLIETMPDEAFTFRPTGEMKTFKSQASHITLWMRSHSRFVTGVAMEKPSMKTKADILQSFNEFFEMMISYLETATIEDLTQVVDMWYGKVTKESVLLTMDNHLSHHRGQMVVYLRLQGVKPPGYIGW